MPTCARHCLPVERAMSGQASAIDFSNVVCSNASNEETRPFGYYDDNRLRSVRAALLIMLGKVLRGSTMQSGRLVLSIYLLPVSVYQSTGRSKGDRRPLSRERKEVLDQRRANIQHRDRRQKIDSRRKMVINVWPGRPYPQ